MAEPLPLDRSKALWGRDLRHAAIALLHQHGPMAIPELIDALERAGFVVVGNPNKTLSDALRWETRLGRLRRVGWGRYSIARLASTTRWRILRRWHLATGHFDPTAPGAYPTPRFIGGGMHIRQWREGTRIGNRLERWPVRKPWTPQPFQVPM